MNLEDLEQENPTQSRNYLSDSKNKSFTSRDLLIQGQGSQAQQQTTRKGGRSREYQPLRYSQPSNPPPNYGGTPTLQEDRSFDNLQNVRNLRSIRSQSSRQGTSAMLGSDSIILDEEESVRNASRTTREITFDDYILFIMFSSFIVFQVLTLLKLEKKIKLPWIIVVTPLCAFEIFVSILAFKKLRTYIDVIVFHKCEKYFFFVLKFLTAKIIIAVTILAALLQENITYKEKLLFTDGTLLLFQIVWLLISLIHSKQMNNYSVKGNIQFVSNQVFMIINNCLWIFSLSNNQYSTLFLVGIYSITFLFNICLYLIFNYNEQKKEDLLFQDQLRKVNLQKTQNKHYSPYSNELLSYVTLFILSVWIFLMIKYDWQQENAMINVLFIYMFCVEIYLFILALKLSESSQAQYERQNSQ